MTSELHTLRLVERFLRESGMAPTRFGRDAVRDPRLVFDMRRGREPTDRMRRRIDHFISSHRARTSSGAGL